MNQRFQRVLAVPVFCVCIVLMMVVAFAHDDDHDQADSVKPGTDSIAVSLSTMPPSANDSLFSAIDAGFQVFRPTFERSCYDCHSSFTHYPWYHKLPIISGMIDDDIAHGKRHVDFTKGFPFTGRGSQADMLIEIKHQIVEGEMPIMKYRLIHWGRLIEGTQQDSIVTWIDSSLAKLSTVGIVPSHKEDE